MREVDRVVDVLAQTYHGDAGGLALVLHLAANINFVLARLDGRELADAGLAQPVVGRRYDVYAMLHGIIHHNVYHTGQIALLRDVSDSHAA